MKICNRTGAPKLAAIRRLPPEKTVTIAQAARLLDMCEHFVRKIVRDSRLRASYSQRRYAIKARDLRRYAESILD